MQIGRHGSYSVSISEIMMTDTPVRVKLLVAYQMFERIKHCFFYVNRITESICYSSLISC